MALDKLDLSFKKLVNRQYTVNEKAWYEEAGGVGFKLKGADVWVEPIPSTPPVSSTSVVHVYDTLTLVVDPTVSGDRCWLADDGGRIGSFISPRYGAEYAVKLYDNANSEIFATDPSDWFFDYETGILTFGNTPPSSGPYKVKVYRYIGRNVDDVSSVYGVDNITGDKTFTDNVHILGTLEVDEATTLNSTLDVTGNTTLKNNTNIQGALTADSTSHFVGNAQFDSNVMIDGDLTVQGTMTTIGTQDLVVKDNRIILNDGEAGAGVTAGSSGIEVDRGTLDNVTMYFDETDDQWKITDVLNDTLVNIAFERPVSVVLHVDVNRTDNYTENGSKHKPFKSIAAALTAASSGYVIQILAGTYSEALTISDDVILRGVGDVTLSGSVAITNSSVKLVNIDITNTNDAALVTVDATSTLTIKDCNCTLSVAASATAAISTSGILVVDSSSIEAPSGINFLQGSLVVKDSSFVAANTGFAGSYGVSMAEPMNAVSFTDNDVSSFASGLIIGSGSGSAGAGPVVIANNKFSANTRDVALYRAQSLEFYRNVLTGSQNVEVLAAGVEDLVVTRFDDNEFLGTTTVSNTKVAAFSAVNNWWGDSTGPDDSSSGNIIQGSGGSIGVNVIAEPFMTRANRTNDIRNTSVIPGHTLEDALNYLESTASPTTNTIYVDPQRVDTYTEDGSAIKPFKTISGAFAYINTQADNSEMNAYVVSLAPAEYTENVTLDSTNFVNISVVSLSRQAAIMNPAAGNAITCNTNNDGFKTLAFYNIDFRAPLSFVGENNDTEFGTNLIFTNCDFNDSVTFNNVVAPSITGTSTINGDVVLENTSFISFVGSAFDAGTFTATLDVANATPLAFADMDIHMSDVVCSRDITWNLIDGNINLVSRNSVIGSSDTSNITVPANVSMVAANCTLLGNYVANGEIDLRGSFVTGNVTQGTGVLSLADQPIRQIDWPVTHVIRVDGSRSDVYTQDGSLARPYKTISDAVSAASAGDAISIAPGTYNEAVTANGIALIGDGNVTITGVVSVTDASVINISFNESVNISTSVDINVDGCNFTNAATFIGDMNITGTMINNGTFNGNINVSACVIYETTDSAITHNGGILRISNSRIYNNSATLTVNSTGGVFESYGCSIVNTGIGDIMSLSNDASSSTPNVLSALVSNSKTILTGTVSVIVDTVMNATINSSAPNRSNIMLQPASQIANDTNLDPDTNGYTPIDISNGNTLVAAIDRMGQAVRYDQVLESFIFDPVWPDITT